MSRRLMLKSRAGVSPVLPAEYQQVEWIGKTASGIYLDTGIVPTNTTGVYIEQSLYPMSLDAATDGVVESGNRFSWGQYPNGVFVGWGTAFTPYTRNLTPGVKFTIRLNFGNSRKAVVNDTEICDLPTRASNTTNLHLFGCHYNDKNEVWNSSEEKIYSAVFTEGTETIMVLVPCYRKTDGEIGFYDTVSRRFITGTGGGTFTKGVDV